MKNKKSNFWNYLIGFLLIIFIMAVFSRGCNSSTDINPESSADTVIAADTTVRPDTTVILNNTWRYSEDEDKMTSKKNYYAEIDAHDLLQFDSPYDGGSTATLTIRKKDGYGNIYLSISKGQFITHSETTFKIRFDDEKAKSYEVSQPSDYSSDLVFFSYYGLIDKIKKHKRMIIQAEFYQEGLRAIEFDISGLKWKH